VIAVRWPADVAGRHAYQVLVAEYFKARNEDDRQREQDLREAIDLCDRTGRPPSLA
jgi:hypothetical protein